MYASFSFEATADNELSIRVGQVLKILKHCDDEGNTEWSYCQDQSGNQGYVPTNYLTPQHQATQ